jgi:hypothetical protein
MAFTSACDIGDKKLKSEAPADTVQSRLPEPHQWIASVADLFHDLMQRQRPTWKAS